jgi:hemoglobin
MSDEQDRNTLYRRLGGYDVIAAIVDDLLAALRADPQFARLGGRSLDSRRRGRQLFVDQMCALAGGPCFYTGRDMKTSHTGLGITEGEWRANMRFAEAALDAQGVRDPERGEFLALFEQFKADIVEQPGAE